MSIKHHLSRYPIAAALLIGGLLTVAAPADAHHAFAAEYDGTKPVELKGTLTKSEWVNPHSWIYVDVKDAAGNVVNWQVEFGAPNALLRRGLRKTDFPPGVEVDVKGYLSKSGKPVAIASTVTLPDGQTLFAGSSGTGNPGDTGQN